MCKYCEGEKVKEWGCIGYSRKGHPKHGYVESTKPVDFGETCTLTIVGNILHVDYDAYSCDSSFNNKITIDFCPMCGKKLEKTNTDMNNIFTICYSEKEGNEIGHFIMRKGYEGVQNDSYRYCDVVIWSRFKNAKRHHSDCIYVGVKGCQMVVSRTKRGLRRNGLKYIEKKRKFYELLSKTI